MGLANFLWRRFVRLLHEPRKDVDEIADGIAVESTILIALDLHAQLEKISVNLLGIGHGEIAGHFQPMNHVQERAHDRQWLREDKVIRLRGDDNLLLRLFFFDLFLP